jgi:hypothetical protein
MAACGPSGSETAIEGANQSLAMSLQANYQQRFAQQNQVLNNLNQSLSPIVAAGPSQQGFSPEELASLNTQAINSAAAANKNAQQAAGNAIAGEGGGGGSGLVSGTQAAIKAGISSNSANQLANTQNEITQANYNQGNQNYQRAIGGEQALAGDYNPQSFANGAESGFGQSFSEANQINQQNQQETKSIIGGIGSLAGAATGGVGNLDTTGSSTAGEQALNFFGGL